MTFNYQKKVWGATLIRLSPTYLGYLRLKYTLDDLTDVKGRILDVGCGGGGFAASIKNYRHDLDVSGVDISKSAIRVAKKLYSNVTWKSGDVYKLPYRDNSFDAIVVADVFEHLEDPQSAMQEISRVMKSGGIMTAYIPLEGSVFSLHKWLYLVGWRAKEKLAGHIQQFTISDLQLSMNTLDMEIQKNRYMPHLFGQVIDIAWFSYLSLLGKKLEVGLEENIEGKSLFSFMKNIVTLVTNFESRLLSLVPGAGVQIKAVKREEL